MAGLISGRVEALSSFSFGDVDPDSVILKRGAALILWFLLDLNSLFRAAAFYRQSLSYCFCL